MSLSISGVPYPKRFAFAIAFLMCLAIPQATAAGQALPGRTASPPADTSPPDTIVHLAALYSIAERNNPRLRAARQFARAVTARIAGATRPPDPELQLGFMNYSVPRLAPDQALGMRQLQLMQMVPLPGKLASAGDAARARAQAADARAGDASWEVRAEIAMEFYEVYSATTRLDIANETRRLLEDAAAVANAMYRVGDGRQADVLRAQVEIARMDEEIIRMRVMADVAQARLAATVDAPSASVNGRPVMPPLPDSLPQREDLVALALRGRPMLSAGAADVRAAVADERLARRELWPDLQVGVQYGERGMEMGVDRMGSLMIGASVPVFARSRQLRVRDEMAAMRAMSEAELRAMEVDTRARVSRLHAELGRARRLATLYRQSVLPQAEAAAESALASYRSGAVDFMTLVENRMTVNRYREELVALVADEGRAWAELEMLTGRTLISPARSR